MITESVASRKLRNALQKSGVFVKRIEDRLGGFPDILVSRFDADFVFGIETKVWRPFGKTAPPLGLRPLQAKFVTETALPYIVVAVNKKDENLWSLCYLDRILHAFPKPYELEFTTYVSNLGLYAHYFLIEVEMNRVCDLVYRAPWCRKFS